VVITNTLLLFSLASVQSMLSVGDTAGTEECNLKGTSTRLLLLMITAGADGGLEDELTLAVAVSSSSLQPNRLPSNTHLIKLVLHVRLFLQKLHNSLDKTQPTVCP
jgi:hypothetical protein